MYGNFTIDWNHRLEVEKVTTSLVEDNLDCTFRCIGEPKCYSLNLAVNRDSGGLYLCELLAIDKYRAVANNLQRNSAFHHYSPWVGTKNNLYLFLFSITSTLTWKFKANR